MGAVIRRRDRCTLVLLHTTNTLPSCTHGKFSLIHILPSTNVEKSGLQTLVSKHMSDTSLPTLQVHAQGRAL